MPRRPDGTDDQPDQHRREQSHHESRETDELQDATHAGPDVQVVHLALFQPDHRVGHVHVGLLDGEPRLHGRGVAGELLLREIQPRGGPVIGARLTEDGRDRGFHYRAAFIEEVRNADVRPAG